MNIYEHNAVILVHGAKGNKHQGEVHIKKHKDKMSLFEQRIAQKRINAYYAKLVKERDNANLDVSGSAHLRGVHNRTLKEAAYLYMTGFLMHDYHN